MYFEAMRQVTDSAARKHILTQSVLSVLLFEQAENGRQQTTGIPWTMPDLIWNELTRRIAEARE